MESKTDRWVNNYNPATNEVVSRVPCATQEEMISAVEAAKQAFPEWKSRSILSRQQIMFQLRDLIKKNMVIIISAYSNATLCTLLLGNLNFKALYHSCYNYSVTLI